MHNETQANLALHQTYMQRGWKTGTTFTHPGRMHYTPRATPKPVRVNARYVALLAILCAAVITFA